MKSIVPIEIYKYSGPPRTCCIKVDKKKLCSCSDCLLSPVLFMHFMYHWHHLYKYTYCAHNCFPILLSSSHTHNIKNWEERIREGEKNPQKIWREKTTWDIRERERQRKKEWKRGRERATAMKGDNLFGHGWTPCVNVHVVDGGEWIKRKVQHYQKHLHSSNTELGKTQIKSLNLL